MDMTGLVTLGGAAGSSAKTALNMGPRRPDKPFHKWSTTSRDEIAKRIDKVLETGVPAKFFREDLGVITLRKGKPGTYKRKFGDGSGLDHIVARRDFLGQDGEAFLRDDLPELLSKGKLTRFETHGRSRTAILENPDNKAAVRLDFDGEPNKWLITGYRKYKQPR